MTSQQPQPLPRRQRGRSWAKLLGPVLGLTVVGTVVAIAVLGLLALAAIVLFSASFSLYGSNK